MTCKTFDLDQLYRIGLWFGFAMGPVAALALGGDLFVSVLGGSVCMMLIAGLERSRRQPIAPWACR